MCENASSCVSAAAPDGDDCCLHTIQAAKKKKVRVLQESGEVGSSQEMAISCRPSEVAFYMGTSLIRNCFLLGPYSRPMLRALWWS